MRLKREDVKIREAFALEQFREGVAVAKVNQSLQIKFGRAMNGKRLYELQALAKTEASAPTPEAVAV